MEMGNLLFGCSRGEIELDRDLLQDVFWQGLAYVGYDSHGLPMVVSAKLSVTKASLPAHDDLFCVRPYWWGDPDSPKATLPNLEVPSADLKVMWYKYALRDAYANREVTPEEMVRIFSDLHDKLVERGWDFELYRTNCIERDDLFQTPTRLYFSQLIA